MAFPGMESLTQSTIRGKSMTHVVVQVWQLKRIKFRAKTGFQTDSKYILSVFFRRILYFPNSHASE